MHSSPPLTWSLTIFFLELLFIHCQRPSYFPLWGPLSNCLGHNVYCLLSGVFPQKGKWMTHTSLTQILAHPAFTKRDMEGRSKQEILQNVSDFSLNKFPSLYVGNWQVNWGSILPRNESWRICPTPETINCLVIIVHTWQKGTSPNLLCLGSCPLMSKVKAAALIQNLFSGRLNPMFGATPELRDKANQPLPFPEPSQNSCKELQGKWWWRAGTGSCTLVPYNLGLESWKTWQPGHMSKPTVPFCNLRERIKWCNSWHRLEAKQLLPPSGRLLFSQSPHCPWFPRLS